MSKAIINLGILAHVDAGKTTIAENLLHASGATRTKGSVDSGTAVTDSLAIEKQRGISVRSAATTFNWNNFQINLIDTPGHADFTAEVERCLSILDGVVLVVSAVEGVQAHTYALWDAMREMHIPTLVVINKMDRQGADFLQVLEELEAELKMNVFPLHATANDGEKNASLHSLWDKEFFTDTSEVGNKAIESIAELDEGILEQYLNGAPVNSQNAMEKACGYCQLNLLVPVLGAIAKEDMGTRDLLDAILKFFTPSANNTKGEMAGLVFKIEHDAKMGRLAHIRIFNGSLKAKEVFRNATRQSDEKVAQLKKMVAQKMESITELVAGDVGVVSGLATVCAGDVLGNSAYVPLPALIQHPVLTVQVAAKKEEQYAALANALFLLNAEDPTLDFTWYKEEKELHLKLMGAIQMEILQSILEERFGIDATFTEPTVIYKETPLKKAEGYVRYWMPKPCWAICKFTIEPGEAGSGIVYESKVSVDKIARKYQNEIEETIPKALKQGIKGWEVTDLKITLIEGEDHQVHSNPGDFVLATPMGIMDGLQHTDTVLLEPMFDFEVKAADELLGSIASDLTTRRAVFANPEFVDGKFVLKGKTPVATSLDFSIKLNSLTSGKGKIKLGFGGYQSCTNEQGVIRPYRGVSPLDQSQWILHRRGAFKADERKI